MSFSRFQDETGRIRTVESIQERELRHHSTGGPCAWRPDPRLFLLPSGQPARRDVTGLGCVTYVDRIMFWGTTEAVDAQVVAWLVAPEWVRCLYRDLG